VFPELLVCSVVISVASFSVRFMRSTWPLVHGCFGLVRRCSTPCCRQMRSKLCSLYRAVGPDRCCGMSQNCTPLSVRTVWIL
jgi:hypothetical protein